MIERIEYSDIEHLLPVLKKYQIRTDTRAKYFGIYIDGELASFVGYKMVGKIATLESGYTLDKYRMRGFYKQLHIHRLNYIRLNEDCTYARVTCTDDSKHLHKKMGATLKHIYRVSRWEKYEYKICE